ncbi:MAG: hypothetical protein IKW62_01600 [Clostridia bacterium]|nr:hypothetical protein [Clostridia bacterium]
MIIEVAEYLSACPVLEGRRVCVNYLAEDEDSISVEVAKSRNSVKEYADGGKMRGITFTLSIRDNFGISQMENKEIAEKCREIENWVEEQNLKGNLPVLKGNDLSVSVGISKCFEIVETKDFSARYQADIELIYYNDGSSSKH